MKLAILWQSNLLLASFPCALELFISPALSSIDFITTTFTIASISIRSVFFQFSVVTTQTYNRGTWFEENLFENSKSENVHHSVHWLRSTSKLLLLKRVNTALLYAMFP